MEELNKLKKKVEELEALIYKRTSLSFLRGQAYGKTWKALVTRNIVSALQEAKEAFLEGFREGGKK